MSMSGQLQIIPHYLIIKHMTSYLVAVCLVQKQTVLASLELKLNVGRDEVHLAFLELCLLAVGSHGGAALGWQARRRCQ